MSEVPRRSVFSAIILARRGGALASSLTTAWRRACFAAGAALPAYAQDNKRIVVGTWGGDYRGCSPRHRDAAARPQGRDVVKDEANAPPRRAKMMAEKTLRRGTSDIQGLSANDMYEVNEQGTAEQLDYSKMPNAANLIPALSIPTHRPHLSGKWCCFNPSSCRRPPASPTRSIQSIGEKLASSISIPVPMLAAGWHRGLDEQLRSGQGAAVACKKGRRTHLSLQRGFRPGTQDRGNRLRHHVEGARREWQNAGISCRDGGAQGGRADVRLGLLVPKKLAQQEVLRLSRRHDGAVGAGSFAVDMGYNPTRHMPSAGRRAEAHRLHRRGEKRLVDLDYGSWQERYGVQDW